MTVSIVLRGGAGDGRRLDHLPLDGPPATVDWESPGRTVVYEYSGSRAGLDYIFAPARLIDRVTPEPAPTPKKTAKKTPGRAAPRRATFTATPEATP